jgi:kynurenine formamidase
MIFPYKLIDLTHILDASIPTWNGKCGFHHDVHIDYSDCVDEDKFRVMKVKMHAGIGTHMDAPSHCVDGGKCIHDFDVNDLIMPCVVIDASNKSHERYSLSVQDIANFERKFGSIAHGSCIMVKTGWSKFWNEPLKYHNNYVFPSVSPDAATLFLERGISALGIDTLSPDRPEDGFKVHKIFLGANKIIIENVANLDSMPTVGGFVMILPIKIKHGTEAPIRLIGLIKKK